MKRWKGVVGAVGERRTCLAEDEHMTSAGRFSIAP
jgi:hypothetical protein